MKYITHKNIVIVAVFVVLGGLGIWTLNSAGTSPQAILEETSATTTPREVSESEDIEPTLSEAVVSVESLSPTQDTREEFPPTPIELGPRQKAELPGDALRLFAEAMKAGDRERALSYFIANQQEQYRNVFEKENKDKQHPVVTAYYNGRVGTAELIQPKYGLYEIIVYPTPNAINGFSINALYDSTVGEFVLTEL